MSNESPVILAEATPLKVSGGGCQFSDSGAFNETNCGLILILIFLAAVRVAIVRKKAA
jgi:hypothetical protein